MHVCRSGPRLVQFQFYSSLLRGAEIVKIRLAVAATWTFIYFFLFKGIYDFQRLLYSSVVVHLRVMFYILVGKYIHVQYWKTCSFVQSNRIFVFQIWLVTIFLYVRSHKGHIISYKTDVFMYKCLGLVVVTIVNKKGCLWCLAAYFSNI